MNYASSPHVMFSSHTPVSFHSPKSLIGVIKLPTEYHCVGVHVPCNEPASHPVSSPALGPVLPGMVSRTPYDAVPEVKAFASKLHIK